MKICPGINEKCDKDCKHVIPHESNAICDLSLRCYASEIHGTELHCIDVNNEELICTKKLFNCHDICRHKTWHQEIHNCLDSIGRACGIKCLKKHEVFEEIQNLRTNMEKIKNK